MVLSFRDSTGATKIFTVCTFYSFIKYVFIFIKISILQNKSQYKINHEFFVSN